jgi:hypothetical protein
LSERIDPSLVREDNPRNMQTLRMLGCAALVGLLLASSCTLANDLAPLKSGNCGSGKKACDEKCVSLDDPETGCSLNTCAPCTLANATVKCAPNGQCAIAACRKDYEDCDSSEANGCEVHTSFDAANCGGCRRVCQPVKNGEPGCSNGACVVSSCDSDHGDCNHRLDDGCESVLATDPQNCGGCGNKCAVGQVCVARQCGQAEAG